MRGTTGTYQFTKGTPDVGTTQGDPSSNLYVPSDVETYTSGDGQSGNVEDFRWFSTLGTEYDGPTLRALYQQNLRVVWYEYRLLTLDQRGLPSLGSSHVVNLGSGTPPPSGTQGTYIDKCWQGPSTDSALRIDAGDPDFPFAGKPVDLSPFVLSCTISQDSTAAVQSTMTLQMKDDIDFSLFTIFGSTIGVAPVDYLYDAVQPIMCLRAPDGGVIRVPMGLFIITSPELDFGGPAGVRTLQCSDLLYFISRNQATMPPGPAYFGSSSLSTIFATTTPLPTQILAANDSYALTLDGPFMTNPCITTKAFGGFVYLIDAIRALLTNYVDDPALPGCGIPPWWIHPQFPHAPDHLPPEYSEWGSQWDWTRNGGVVDMSGPVMDAVVPQAVAQVFTEGQGYLEIINSLLYAGGFDPLFVTDNVTGPAGTLPCLNVGGGSPEGVPVVPQLLTRPWPPKLDYSVLDASWVYDTTKDSIVVPGSVDRFSMDQGANVICLVMDASDRTTLYVWAANVNPDSPISLRALGRRLVNVIHQSNIPKDLAGSDRNYARTIALYELNKGAALFETLQFSTAVVPFHTSLDRLAVNIQQRFYAIGSPYNLPGVVGGLVLDTGNPRAPITLADVFIEQGWQITIPAQAPGNAGFPGSSSNIVSDLAPLVQQGGATMSHTVQRYTRITPGQHFDLQAGPMKWLDDSTTGDIPAAATGP